MIKALVFLVSAAVLVFAHDEVEVVKHATVLLKGGRVEGNISFTVEPDGNIRVAGKIVGMPRGKYGFHVHEKGDITGGCHSTGGHFNPHGHDHGHHKDDNAHVGDLPNVEFNHDGVAFVDFVNHKIKLSGGHNIIGRALVLRSQKDDYGHSHHPDSKIDGNTGARVACGVIGIA